MTGPRRDQLRRASRSFAWVALSSQVKCSPTSQVMTYPPHRSLDQAVKVEVRAPLGALDDVVDLEGAPAATGLAPPAGAKKLTGIRVAPGRRRAHSLQSGRREAEHCDVEVFARTEKVRGRRAMIKTEGLTHIHLVFAT